MEATLSIGQPMRDLNTVPIAPHFVRIGVIGFNIVVIFE